MLELIGERGCGKTGILIRIANNNYGYIIVRTENEKNRIIDKAFRMGCKINEPIVLKNLMRGKTGPFFIDNYDIDMDKYLEDFPHETMIIVKEK